MPCDDCSRAEDCPPCVNEPEGSDDSSTNPRCGNGDCGHLRSSHFNRDRDDTYCIGNRNLCPCDGFQFPESEAEPPPPQPLRRPPYAVAYSVGGHLYEIALPGDATINAMDGGLIITHSFAPVAGVVRVHPIEGEQSA